MVQFRNRTVLGLGHPFESILKSFRVYLHRSVARASATIGKGKCLPVWHVFGNMIFLFVFGDDIEEVLGHWRFLASCAVSAPLLSTYSVRQVQMNG